MKRIMIGAMLAALALSGARAQSTMEGTSGTAGSGTTNGAMQPRSTGAIGAMHSSSTDPAAGGSPPAPAATADGMTVVDGKYMMRGKPATKAQIATHEKTMQTPPY